MRYKKQHISKKSKCSPQYHHCTCLDCLRIRKYERPRFDDLEQFDDLDIFKKDNILFKK